MRAIFLRCAIYSHSEPPEWCTNLAALVSTRSKALIWHSLYGSQHAAPYSRMASSSDVYAKIFVILFPPLFFLQYALRNGVPYRLYEPCNLPDHPSLNHFVWWLPNICNSFRNLLVPQGNILADPSPRLSWRLASYFYSDLFSFNILPPPNPPNLSRSVCNFSTSLINNIFL